MKFIKKNNILLLGIAIPILMTLFVAGSIYIPSGFVQPKFNFLYVMGNNYNYYNYYNGQIYSVENNTLIKNKVKLIKNKPDSPMVPEAKLFVYDVIKNESSSISFEEAKKLKLNTNVVSPDGFEVISGNDSGGVLQIFFYSGSDYNRRYLKGHYVSKKLNGSFGYDFLFLGWIIPQNIKS